MSVFLDVLTRLDRRSAETALAEARQLFQRGADDIGRGLSGALNRSLGAIDGSAARKTLQELRAEHQSLTAAAAEAHRVMTRSLGDVETRTRRLSEVTAKYGADSSQASSATVALADAHAIAARNTRIHEQAATDAAAAHAAMSTATDKTATSLGAMASIANGVGVASIVGLGAAMAGTTKMAGDFQASQTRLVASAGETASNLKVVSDGILKMAGDVGYSAQQLSTAMYGVEKAGYRGADGVNVLKAAAQGAKSENADLGEVLQGLTTSMHDFGYGPEQAADVMSKMVAAVGASKTTFQEFSASLHSVEPVAAAAGLKLEDVYSTLAMMTKSGASADQSTQNMRNAINALTGSSQPARDAMAQFGINADEVSQKLSQRGLAGTMEYLFQTVQQKLMPGMKVNQGALLENAQAASTLNDMMSQMSPAAAKMADEFRKNEIGPKDFTKAAREMGGSDAAKLLQFEQLNLKLDGFSKATRTGRDQIETLGKALRDMTGTVAGQSVALQVTGDHYKETTELNKQLTETTRESDGTVKGFNETSETLNNKLDKAKAAFGAAGIEVGTMFIPVMTEVANAARSVGEFMAEHPGLAHAAADAMIGLAGAWTVWKIVSSDAVKAVVSGLGTVMEKLGLTTTTASATNAALADAGPSAERGAAGVQAAAQSEIGEENAVADAALRADGALAGGGGGVGNTASRAENEVSRDVRAGSRMIPGFIPLPDPGQLPVQNGRLVLPPDAVPHAAGGPIYGSGPKGKDSVPAWLAPGEHVLTAADVDAAGGHAGVYAWRNALHRETGGPSDDNLGAPEVLGQYGSDVQAAAHRVGVAYSNALRDDCSGMVGKVVNEALGIAGSDLPTTRNMGQWLAERGFVPGIGGPGDVSVGWYNHGSGTQDGHAAMTLSNGMNAESGGAHGNFLIGRGAAGASNPEFDQHMYLPGGSGGQRLFAAQDRVHKLEDRIAVLQQRIAEETSKTKESEKIRLDDELKRAQDELSHAKDQLAEVERSPRGASGYGRSGGRGSRGGGSGGGLQFGAPLPENFGLGKGIPGFFEWLTTFLADMAIGPIEGAMYGDFMRSGGAAGGGFGDIADQVGVPLASLGADPTLGGNHTPPGGGSSGGGSAGSGSSGGGSGSSGSSSSGGSGGSSAGGLWWAPGSKPAGQPLTDMAGTAPAAPGAPGPGRFIGPVSQSDLAQGALLGGLLGTAPNYGWRNPGNPVLDLLNPSRDPSGIGPAPFGSIGGLGGGMNLSSLGAPSAASNNMYQQFYGYGKRFATGGPSGTDTIPAWLSPGEFVMNAQATKNNLGMLQMMNAGHYDTGGQVTPTGPGGSPLMIQDDQGNVIQKGWGRPTGVWGPWDEGIRRGSPNKDPGASDGSGITPWFPSMRGMSKQEGDEQITYPWGMRNLYAATGGLVGYYDTGTQQPVQPGAPVPKMPGGGAQQPKPMPKQGQQGQPHLTGSVNPGPGNTNILGGSDVHPGVATPGADTQQFGEGLPASSGIGFGGGLVGGLEQAAAGAASAAGGAFGGGGGAAAGMALNAAFQMMNRTAGYVGQLGGIAAEGVLSTLLPADSPLSNFSNTLPGKLIAGVAGVRPGQPNSAGKTEAPLKTKGLDERSRTGEGQNTGDTNHIGAQYNGPITVKADNPQAFQQQMQREFSGARAAYPTNLP